MSVQRVKRGRSSSWPTWRRASAHPGQGHVRLADESRRILFAACTESPDSGWVTQQARNLTWELTELGLQPRFLIRDRDAKFVAAFDSVLAAEGTEVRRTPPRSPRANSIAERWVASARR